MLIFVIFGLIIGSFLNAVIWRIHAKRSIAKGRSQCPDCKHDLGVLDLVPVFSWLMLGGRCRYCKKPVSIQYPLAELATAALFGLSYVVLKPAGVGWVTFFWWLYILSSLIVLTVYDLRWMLLPDVVMLPAIVITAAYWLAYMVVVNRLHFNWGPLLAALIGGGIFYALAAVSDGRWMGGGDVKLAFLMGFVLGPKNLLVAMILGFNAAAIVAIVLIIVRAKGLKDQLAFGPFLAAATVVAFLYGAQIINWYTGIASSWLIR